jgi:Ni,Fe-hydrogenase III component G
MFGALAAVAVAEPKDQWQMVVEQVAVAVDIRHLERTFLWMKTPPIASWSERAVQNLLVLVFVGVQEEHRQPLQYLLMVALAGRM